MLGACGGDAACPRVLKGRQMDRFVEVRRELRRYEYKGIKCGGVPLEHFSKKDLRRVIGMLTGQRPNMVAVVRNEVKDGQG